MWRTLPAAYALPDSNSLQQESGTGYTLLATLYLGARPRQHTEVFVNPKVIQTVNISDLHGLGGMSNSENRKGGKQTPTIYPARAFVRQTISFGGDPVAVDAGQNQFADTVGSRRLVITAGLMPLIDLFDTNPYGQDHAPLRRSLLRKKTHTRFTTLSTSEHQNMWGWRPPRPC